MYIRSSPNYWTDRFPVKAFQKNFNVTPYIYIYIYIYINIYITDIPIYHLPSSSVQFLYDFLFLQ